MRQIGWWSSRVITKEYLVNLKKYVKDAETFANSQNIKYFETSAKSGVGVEEMFTEITKQALTLKKQDQQQNAQSNGAARVDLNAKGAKDKKKCC